MQFPEFHRTLQRSSRQTPPPLPDGFAATVFGAISQRRLRDAAWVRFLLRWSPVAAAAGLIAFFLLGSARKGSHSSPPALELYGAPGAPGKPLTLP